MAYVVSSAKIFKTFDSMSEANDFQSKSFGTTLYEQDMFGNLKKLPQEEIASRIILEKEAAQIEKKPSQKQHALQAERAEQAEQPRPQSPLLQGQQPLPSPQQGLAPASAEPKKKKFIKYLTLFIMIVITAVLLVIVWPYFVELFSSLE